MFLLALLQDSEIQKERSLILYEHVTYILERLERIEKAQKEPESYWQMLYPDYNEVKASAEADRLRQQRTKHAIKVATRMRHLESYVPLALAGAAVLALAKMFYDAL